MYNPYFNLKGNGVPILSNKQIEKDAMAFIKDFDPDMFENPHALDIDAFVEMYLGLDVDFLYLRRDDSLLGEMIFQNFNNYPVFSPIKLNIELISVKRGTMLINETLEREKKASLRRTTMGHEAGHWIYHQTYFSNGNKACRDSEREINRKRLVTEQDWLEHHANLFGAAILMPLRPFVRTVMDERTRALAWRDVDLIGQILVGDQSLAYTAAKVFHVSESAAMIRLHQLKLDILSEAKYVGGDKMKKVYYCDDYPEEEDAL